MVIFPWIQLLRRALDRSAAAELGARFLPMERNYPALARWIDRIESLPGYERTYPPHWRESLRPRLANWLTRNTRQALRLRRVKLNARDNQHGNDMMSNHEVHVKFAGRIVFVGFGSIGQGVLPLILRHIGTSADRITIVTAEDAGRAEAEQFGVKFVKTALTRENYRQTLEPLLGAGDFLLNLSVDVSSVALIELARERGALYLDTCIEPWAGGYIDPKRHGRDAQQLRHAPRGAGAARAAARALRPPCSRTAPIPAWCRIWSSRRCSTSPGIRVSTPGRPRAASNGRSLRRPSASRSCTSPSATPRSATCRRRLNEFVNTWSVDGFVSEGAQPAELGWGTHEKHFPADGGTPRARIGLRDLPESPRREHPRAHLDAQGGAFPRLSDHAFRGHFARRLLHGHATASGWCTAPPRTTPIIRATTRCCRCTSSRGATGICRTRKRIMLDEITDGHRRTRRAARRTQEECLLVRLAAVDRGGAQAGAVQQRHQPAGDRGGALRDDLGDGESRRAASSSRTRWTTSVRSRICMPYLGTVVGEYTDWTPLYQRGELFAEDLDTDGSLAVQEHSGRLSEPWRQTA